MATLIEIWNVAIIIGRRDVVKLRESWDMSILIKISDMAIQKENWGMTTLRGMGYLL